MTRYEAHIAKGWKDFGLTQLLVARIRDDGSADIAVFLVDTFCLGVKDAFHDADVPPSEVEDSIAKHLPQVESERIHPSCAKKLIEGALAYAETLGFAPHRDFRKARRVLSGLDAEVCPTEFTFGREGRPCYVQGPDDTEERVERVLATLEARCGTDGFDYELVDEEDDDVPSVRQDLIDWLAAEPLEVPRFYFVSGMIAALHLCPHPIAPTKIFDALWPDGREWADEAETEDFAALLLDYWNHVGERVQDALAPGAAEDVSIVDVLESDLPAQDEAKGYDALPFMAALVEWAGGFHRATELWPEAWGDTRERADLAPHWEMVRWWAEFVEHKADIDAAAASIPPRNFGTSVKALARALGGHRPPPSVT